MTPTRPHLALLRLPVRTGAQEDAPGRLAAGYVGRLAAFGGLLMAIVLVAGAGLRAGFVSDAWVFLGRARDPLSEIWPWFVPHPGETFYRPGVELAFWIGDRLFGLDPLPYHLVAFLGHAISAGLVGMIAWRLTGSRAGAVAASLALLFAVSAQEVLFDVGDLHNALAAPLLFGAVLAGMSRRRWIPAGLIAIAIFIDETAILALPLLGIYLLAFERSRWRDLIPLAIITVAYLSVRVAMGLTTEAIGHCLTFTCIVAGMDEYSSRLLLRPDALIVQHAAGLPALALGALVALIGGRHWTHWPAFRYGLIWAVGTSLFFVLSLFPYTADRFLYIPTGGIATAIGALVAQAIQRWQETGLPRLRGAMGVGLIAVWIAAGALTLWSRSGSWTAAGDEAQAIVTETVRLYPHPPLDAVLAFSGVPEFGAQFPPGNSGPYIFHNGLSDALALAYGRDDLQVVELRPNEYWPPGVAHFAVGANGTVRSSTPPR